MPKISKSQPKPKSLSPKELGYAVVPYPESKRQLEQESGLFLNLQICACGHDRCCHSYFYGEGEKQVRIQEPLSAGKCLNKKCGCTMFRYDPANTSAEGKKRRAEEEQLFAVVPPTGTTDKKAPAPVPKKTTKSSLFD